MSAPAMDDLDDMLIDLLSYECPFTGKKRTAGMMTPDQIEPDKRTKFPAVKSFLDLNSVLSMGIRTLG